MCAEPSPRWPAHARSSVAVPFSSYHWGGAKTVPKTVVFDTETVSQNLHSPKFHLGLGHHAVKAWRISATSRIG
jgi:hypothetical protein